MKRIPTGLSARIRHYFGWSQQELGRLLGVSQVQVAQAGTGNWLLPNDAAERLRKLAPLLDQPVSPPPLPDRGPLQARHAAILDQARRLRFRLQYAVPDRALPAHHRLAATDTLLAALAVARPAGRRNPAGPAGAVAQRCRAGA